MKRCISVIILVFFCAIAAGAKDLKNVHEILNKVKSEYLSLKAYSDIGFVQSSYESINFKTQFVKPNLFTFIWSSKLATTPPVIHNFAIWSDGKEVYSYYSYEKKIETEENLNMAIAGATGVSLGAIHKVSAVLDLASGFKITKISKPVLIGEKVVEKELCYYIKGKHTKYETTYDLFFSKSTFMIRKIIVHSKTGRRETVYKNILINPDIPISGFDQKQIIEKQIKQ